MSSMRKFLFDTSFDAGEEFAPQAVEAPVEEPELEEIEEEVAPEPEEPPEPTFSEQELALAKQEAYEEGKRVGAEESWQAFRSQTDQMAVQALRKMSDNMQDIAEAHRETLTRSYEDALAVSVAIASTLLPEMAARGGNDEVEAVVRRCLDRLSGEPKVTIRVADSVVQHIHERLGPLVDELGFEGHITLQTSDEIGPSDVKMSWNGGGAERDAAKIWEEIDAAVEQWIGIQVPQRPDPAPEVEAAPDAADGTAEPVE